MTTVFAEDIIGTLFQTKYNNNNYNINPYFHVVWEKKQCTEKEGHVLTMHIDIVVHPLNHKESQNFSAYRLKVLIKEFEMY